MHMLETVHIERARLGASQNVAVELIVNGVPVDSVSLTANGEWQNIAFNYMPQNSSWIALRIYASSHTNPVFVTVDGNPIAVKKSAQWCKSAVERCWKMKENNIRKEERADARKAYDTASAIYDNIILKGK